jgi:hypothetical protein
VHDYGVFYLQDFVEDGGRAALASLGPLARDSGFLFVHVVCDGFCEQHE